MPAHGARRARARLAAHRPGLADSLIKAADDPELRVRFQVAIALGDFGTTDRASAALARIAAQDADDDWVRLAVLSGLGEKAWSFLCIRCSSRTQGGSPRRPPGQGQDAVVDRRHSRSQESDRGTPLLAAQLTLARRDSRRRSDALLVGLSDGLARAGRPCMKLLKAGYCGMGFEESPRLARPRSECDPSSTDALRRPCPIADLAGLLSPRGRGGGDPLLLPGPGGCRPVGRGPVRSPRSARPSWPARS